MSDRESLYHKYPEYRVELEPGERHYEVWCFDLPVAATERALVVRETRHDPVVYFLREDVRFDLLERSDHRTFCPFKGEASYWTLRSGERVEENLVWSYEDPFPQVARLKDYVSFYRDRTRFDPAPDG